MEKLMTSFTYNLFIGYLRLIKNNVYFYIGLRRFHLQLNSYKDMFILSDNSNKIFIKYPNRVGFYVDGIENRLNMLASSFGVNKHIFLKSDDVVIDVGGNIGEFSIYCSKYVKKIHLFDPDPYIYLPLCENLKDCNNVIVNPLGLSNETGEAKFYLKGDTADSSLIFNGANNFQQINIIRFENYFNESINGPIKLFKCDAEGAEPEVLKGLGNSINYIEYFAIDCGPERGVNNERTSDFVRDYLLSNNFSEINDNGNKREILFFKNLKFI